jgi:3D (Asp-Asp-Asp) domain-containing protein
MNQPSNGHNSRGGALWRALQGLAVLGFAFLTSCTSPSGTHLAQTHFAQGLRDRLHSLRTPEPETPPNKFVIKTTAYCHQESDSKQYGKLTARGNQLRCSGPIRSAAADWSRYPVGTRFRIIGQSQVYEVDDYGSALVGTDTIDIYQPTMKSMRNWGAPVVGIEVVQWGSYAESESILAPRASKSPYIRQMLAGVRAKSRQMAQGGMPPLGPIGVPGGSPAPAATLPNSRNPRTSV